MSLQRIAFVFALWSGACAHHYGAARSDLEREGVWNTNGGKIAATPLVGSFEIVDYRAQEMAASHEAIDAPPTRPQ